MDWSTAKLAYSSALLVFLLLLLATQLITPQIAAFIAIVYWGYLLILCTLLMWRAKNWRHQSFLWLMLIILVLNAYYFAYPAGTVLWQIVDIMIASISIANFRIARAIGNQALDDAQDERRFIPHPIYKNLTIITMILLVISQFYYGLTIQAYLALAVGFAFLARLNDWHNIIFLRCHYIRAHYVITLLIALGYLFLGMSLLSHNAYIQAARHLIAIGGMLAMIYLTISIAGLRHSHLKLKFHWYTRLGLVLIFIAALSRSIGVVIFPSTLNLIILPTVLITLSFLCYLSVYLPIFLIKK